MMSKVALLAHLAMANRTMNGDLMKRSNQGGFTYLAALFLIVVMGVMLGAVGKIWSTAQQREKERELLFVGNQFRQAIGRYYNQSPGGAKIFPLTLEDMLLDPRQLGSQRYLRKIYRDPMTGQPEWALLKVNERITGVYSLSEDAPLKSGNFRLADKTFEDAEKYSDWKFVYTPLN